jgi:hypothetical protein
MKIEQVETTIIKEAMKLSGLIYKHLGKEQEEKIAKTILKKIEGAEDEAKRKRVAQETGKTKPTERS